jgi:hypothetical protein
MNRRLQPCNHYTTALLVTNTCAHELPHQEGLSLQVQLRTRARIGRNATKLADECIAHESEVLQTIEQ